MSSHITYTKKILIKIVECKIDMTVVNVQKMKCELKGAVNMKPQGGKTVKFTDVLYVTQGVKNILSGGLYRKEQQWGLLKTKRPPGKTVSI